MFIYAVSKNYPSPLSSDEPISDFTMDELRTKSRRKALADAYISGGLLTITDENIEHIEQLVFHAFFHISERHPDYAFELETGWRDSEKKKRHSGWFVNRCKVTEVYGFLYWNGTPDKIENMRVCLVRKKDIIEELTSLGVDVGDWKSYTELPPKIHNGNHYWFIHENIRITKSMSLPEQPLNLIVPWYFLKDIVIFDKLFRLSDSEIETAA